MKRRRQIGPRLRGTPRRRRDSVARDSATEFAIERVESGQVDKISGSDQAPTVALIDLKRGFIVPPGLLLIPQSLGKEAEVVAFAAGELVRRSPVRSRSVMARGVSEPGPLKVASRFADTGQEADVASPARERHPRRRQADWRARGRRSRCRGRPRSGRPRRCFPRGPHFRHYRRSRWHQAARRQIVMAARGPSRPYAATPSRRRLSTRTLVARLPADHAENRSVSRR